MKAKLEQLSLEGKNASFHCYGIKVPGFKFLWHYHPEYELTYIIKGKGKRFVGDSYESFDQGDLVLLGSMLPHTWMSETAHRGSCEAIVIQFSKDFIEPLFRYPEMNGIRVLLSKAKNGLYFARAGAGIVSQIGGMIHFKGVDAFAALIRVFDQLAGLRGAELSSGHFKPFKGNENQQRINKVFMYVQREYTGRVSLQKAASIVHLSESAFCKFFKRVSGKTFSDYVNEIRIAKACELLIETDQPIEQVAFETGFESQTYFNRIFLKKKGLRPRGYRSSNAGG